MKAYFKDILKEIFKSKIKFIALFVITTLGVSTFIGLNILSYDMKKTLDNIYKEYNVYDIKISNSLGLDDVDREIISNYKDVLEYEYNYNKDMYIKGSHNVISLNSYPEKISKLNIIEGNFNNKNNEIILEYKNKSNYKIGDKLELENGEIFTITGYFENVEYREMDISENSFIGYGKSNLLAYTSSNYFKDDKPTIVKLRLKDTNDLETYTKEYEKIISKNKLELENLLNTNSINNLNNFKTSKLNDINDGYRKIEEYKNELDYNQNKLINAQKLIDDSNLELMKKENEFKNASSKLKNAEKEIKLNQEKLENANNTIISSEKELLENKEKVLEGLSKIEDGFKEIEKNENQLILGREELNKNKNKVNSLKPSIFLSKNKIEDYKLQIQENEDKINKGFEQINLEKEKLINTKNDLLDNLDKINKGIEEIEKNKTEITDNYILLMKAKDNLEKESYNYYKDYNKNLNNINLGKNKIIDSQKELNSNLEKFNTSKEKANVEIEDNLKKLDESSREINSLKPLTLVLTRFDNASYVSYLESTDAINIISKFFPIAFLFIVILVTTTTMTRMVDEHRGIIGTYKFLGYSNTSILFKYLVYSLIPTTLGILFGIYLGIYIFPNIIYIAYKASSITTFSNLHLYLDYKYIVIAIFVSIITNVLSVYLSLKKEIKLEVSNLLRPKVSIVGSKIFLENIKFIWEKLKFFNKLTLRNLWRYKGRMIMNIMGTLGCASLIFFAFAIKNSLKEMPNIQFNNIMKYEASINLKSYLNDNEIDEFLKNNLRGKEILRTEKIDAKFNINEIKESPITIFVVEDLNKISRFVSFFDNSNKEYNLNENGILISERALSLMNKKVGDNIEIKDYYGNKYNLKIENVFKNYFSNYIFVSKEYFENNGYEYKTNNILLKNVKEKTLYDKLLDSGKVNFISLESENKSMVDKTTESLNVIVVFITLLSGLLSIVVTYSLLDINVSERNRELATIKVLGFYSSEVSLYIYRELLILTIIGILLGYLGGNLLHYTILESMKETRIVFVEITGITPYIFSTILTAIFSIISMLFIHRRLSKINMVEALKME